MEGNSRGKFHGNFNLRLETKDESQADVYDNIWGKDPTPWLERVREARLNREMVRPIVEHERIKLQRKWVSLSPTQQKENGERFSAVVRAIEENLDDPQKLDALIRRL